MTEIEELFLKTHGHHPVFTPDNVQAILRSAYPSAEILSVWLFPNLGEETWMANLKINDSRFESQFRNDCIIELTSVDFDGKTASLTVKPAQEHPVEAWAIVDVCHMKNSPVMPCLKGIFTSYARARKNFLAMCKAHPEEPVGDTLTVPLEHDHISLMSIMRTRFIDGDPT